MSVPHQIIISPSAACRLERARAWLETFPPDGEILILASVREAADDLVRSLGLERGARFGIHRLTLRRLVGLLAADRMAASRTLPAAGLALEAVAALAVQRLGSRRASSSFAPVIDRPGFARALAHTLDDLRLNAIPVDGLAAQGGAGGDLAELLRLYDGALSEARLADRGAMIPAAIEAAQANPAARFVGLPTLLLDVEIEGALERDLIHALAARSPAMLATVPGGDARSGAMLEAALGVSAPEYVPDGARGAGSGNSLDRLQAHLFSSSAPPPRELDDSVSMFSAAGEVHECVEIARRIQSEARAGVPFDRMAVCLHQSTRYAPLIEEALERAGVPFCFARGLQRPDPGGRAMLVLLAWTAEDFAAPRFAEYLSLGQMPASNLAPNESLRLVPDSEFVPERLSADFPTDRQRAEPDSEEARDEPALEEAGRKPSRWEGLIVEAAVIGGADRWETRLTLLEDQLKTRRSEAAPGGSHRAAIDRRLEDLADLKTAALSLIRLLQDLPREATWQTWIDHLNRLAELAVRDRDSVVAALWELRPMGPVGPVGLDEVRMVLARRIGRREAPRPRRRYGGVFVAPLSVLRGMSFEVVFVPGLAERLFPRKLTEDPLLPDSTRRRLGGMLQCQEDRVWAERLKLRLAVGAAERRLVLSYPRLDLDQGRPRVPSIYALEVHRAAEGRLPGFDELSRRASGLSAARLGWPIPQDPTAAIDDTEFDLALLDRLAGTDPEATRGAAHYLLGANPHLARALRTRARRWLKRWTRADGLVDPEAGAMAVLRDHQLSARSYSPTALQRFAACPYQFFLQAIFRLSPREDALALETMDPLTRGSLIHELQFDLLSRLRAGGSLPIGPENLAAAQARLDETLDEASARWREELAPAIERVWNDAIEEIRADLREWLRRAALDEARWRPEHFELSFGLADRAQADPQSSPDPVLLDGGLKLRGSIDLVERDPAGRLRATDHKTGRVRVNHGFIIRGGATLQPVLYALAVEKLLGEPCAWGRLYYCSATGGYQERTVAIDDRARDSARFLIETLRDALSEGFFPAAPWSGECRRCDYRRICGPYEERRSQLKPSARLAALRALREIA